MSALHTIPTKLAVDRAWQRYSTLHLAIQADPHAREDPVAKQALDRAHERFCNLYNEWGGH